MSRPVPSVPRLPARLRAWFRVPLVLVAVFATALPMASASAAVPPPPALAAESGGESQPDGAETDPTPPARPGTPQPKATRPRPPRAPPPRTHPHLT
ncbi:hypothetical protein RMO59_33895, partial [Streptomyces alfalfae]